MAKGYTMLVEIQEDRMGNLLGSPVSEKHQKDLEAEYGTYEGFAQEGMPLHYEIMEYLSDGAKSEISRGWPARVRFPIDAYWHWVEFHRTEDSHFKNPKGNPGLLESLEKMRERESWPWAFFGSDGKVYAEPPEHVSFRARRVPPDELESAQATARHEEEVYGRAERSHKGNPEDFSQQVAYPFYVVEKASGKVLGGWDYREDAQDDRDELVEDSGWKKSALSIMTQKGLLRKWGAIQWTSDRVWSREARQARLKGNPPHTGKEYLYVKPNENYRFVTRTSPGYGNIQKLRKGKTYKAYRYASYDRNHPEDGRIWLVTNKTGGPATPSSRKRGGAYSFGLKRGQYTIIEILDRQPSAEVEMADPLTGLPYRPNT